MTPASWLAPPLVAAAVTALATPMVGQLARAVGVIDRPDERKVNRRQDIPLLGGLAVALGFYVGLAVAKLLTGEHAEYRNHIE
ncbi:MAG TPA: hypothetical protein VMI75_38920, partial [Polyangiaceae bacterium]|nr:hypothetical protein [Polyangiaceae bacterium]